MNAHPGWTAGTGQTKPAAARMPDVPLGGIHTCTADRDAATVPAASAIIPAAHLAPDASSADAR